MRIAVLALVALLIPACVGRSPCACEHSCDVQYEDCLATEGGGGPTGCAVAYDDCLDRCGPCAPP